MEKIKVGIIGCGGIARGKHYPSLKKMDDVEIVAFCDIIPERAQKLCDDYGNPNAKVYTDYKELLKDESIVAVHVLTPNRSHSFITIDALEAGKHVMCEKPMAINYKEALAMAEAAKRTGKKLSELAKMMQTYPQVLVNVSVSPFGKQRCEKDKAIAEAVAKVEKYLGDDGRVLVRVSGTEPLVRVMLEGKDIDLITEYANEIAEVIKERLI